MIKTLLPFFILSFCGVQAQTIPKTFRSFPGREKAAGSPASMIFDTKDWNFFAGAPIRSTPLISGKNLFFGNTKGEFDAVNRQSGKLAWQFRTGYAINSSAVAQDGAVFFADNKQTVYSLSEATGRMIWKFEMSAKKDYPWRFDYFYSSPAIYEGSLLIGGDDGYIYSLERATGRLLWKFKAEGIVRSSPALFNQTVVIGDMEGRMYGLDIKTGRERWVFKTDGDSMVNDSFGFDRKGILSSPVIEGARIVFGCRDGFLYCIDTTGKFNWKMNHHVSWVISTVAILDSFVVTGTSDGHFVQAVDLYSGKEIWKFRGSTLFWSSPLIEAGCVYIGGFDGNEYCLDLKSGLRISQFQAAGIILSSAVSDGKNVFFGSDDGHLYSLKPHPDMRLEGKQEHFVFYEDGINIYFKNGSDRKIKTYLENSGYKTIASDSLLSVLGQPIKRNTVIVFASDYIPPAASANGKSSLLRRFLDAGGRIVLAGLNPLTYEIDEKEKQAIGFNLPHADSVFGINYGPNDTRGFGGQFTCFPTGEGKRFGLPDFWSALLQVGIDQVTTVLGKNENGFVSSFSKSYTNGGRLVQIWMNPDAPDHMDAILKLSEWKID